MIKHLTPRPDDDINNFFSDITFRELINIAMSGDKYAENLLCQKLHVKKIVSVNAVYLWYDGKLATTMYVQVEYTMLFIVERSEIHFLLDVMNQEFGNKIEMHNYDYMKEELTIKFRS